MAELRKESSRKEFGSHLPKRQFSFSSLKTFYLFIFKVGVITKNVKVFPWLGVQCLFLAVLLWGPHNARD